MFAVVSFPPKTAICLAHLLCFLFIYFIQRQLEKKKQQKKNNKNKKHIWKQVFIFLFARKVNIRVRGN